MGKKWFDKKKNRTAGKNQASKYEKPKKVRTTVVGYEDLVRESPDFETFYKAQNIVPPEDWDTFIGCLKEDLPAAFRLTGSKNHAYALLKVLQDKFFNQVEEKLEDVEVTVKPLKPVCLPWYPDNLAWQLNLTRKDIRRSETFWKLHQFLISETDTGNISRQEAVSMLPPLLLDVKHDHKVLDMCAAPGSKTAQIIEYLHSSCTDESSIPSGIVVANDCDNKRCYMLTHQAKRLQSPTLVVTNHDAAFMPNIHLTRKDGTVGVLKFDRILCDVPCSGDGTLRKNFDVWTKWNAANGANLHGLQLRIARRGLEMLTVGGRLVYSTCSLNPLENEAVINRLLEEAGNSVALVDVSSSLEGLKFVPGILEWKVMNKELEIFLTPEDIPARSSNLIHKRLYPPSKEDAATRNLNRCVRILPHHQDTGGFFVAVLEKLKPLPGEKVYAESDDKDSKESKDVKVSQRVKPPPKKRRRGYKEEPFYYMAKENPIWQKVYSFYGIKESVNPSLFLTRTQDGKGKNLYFTNALVKDIILTNESRIKIINTGVKVFVRCDNKGSSCDFRLAQEGSHVLLPLFEKRKLFVEKEDMISMLQNDDVEMPPQIMNLSPNTQKQCEDLDCGSASFTYIDNSENPLEITLVGWKAKRSLRCYVVKNERLHYLRLLHADTSAFERNKFAEQRMLESKEAEKGNNGAVEVEKGNNEAVKEEKSNNGAVKEEKINNEAVKEEKINKETVEEKAKIEQNAMDVDVLVPR